MTTFDYDLFVIGTGEAGTTVAEACRAEGWRVAIADDNPFGGTCALRGCNPKRTLAGAVELLHRAQGMHGNGFMGKPALDWEALFDFKERLRTGIPQMSERTLKETGIDTFHGVATFTGTNEITIDGKTLSFRHALIGAGSKPRPLGIPGEEHLTTSDALLSIRSLPSRILFVGAGYISMEFAHAIAASDTSVTLLEYAPSPLLGFDTDLVSMLVRKTREQNIDLRVNSRVDRIVREGGRFRAYAAGTSEPFEADLVVHGAGRIPKTDNLGLDEANIKHDGHKIKVNQYLQSVSNASVYVAGDAHAQGIQLTPVAEQEGAVVAHNLLHGNSSTPDYTAVPSVVFTHPSLASVGMRHDPDNVPTDIQVTFRDTSSKHITTRLGLTSSAFKMLTNRRTRKIEGMHMLGYNVDEVINLFSFAMRSGMTLDQLKRVPWTFPSVTYDTLFRA